VAISGESGRGSEEEGLRRIVYSKKYSCGGGGKGEDLRIGGGGGGGGRRVTGRITERHLTTHKSYYRQHRMWVRRNLREKTKIGKDNELKTCNLKGVDQAGETWVKGVEKKGRSPTNSENLEGINSLTAPAKNKRSVHRRISGEKRRAENFGKEKMRGEGWEKYP